MAAPLQGPVAGPATVRAAATGQPVEERSIGELLGAMTSDLSTIIRKEVELAKVEVKEEAQKAGKGAGLLGAGGFAAHLALLFASFALAFGLDALMWRWIAFSIVAVIYAVAAFVLFKAGQKELKAVQPPRQTIDTVKEDVQWARAQTS